MRNGKAKNFTRWTTLLVAAIVCGASIVLPASSSANGRGRDHDRLTRWCDDSLLTLERARQDADIAYYRGDLDRAYHALVDGLSRVQAQSSFGQSGPLTALVVDRGLILADAIVRASAGEPSGMRTSVYFLFKYYNFITRVTREIDYPYYIPFRDCRTCRHAEEAVFEKRFVQYTKEQVEMVLETLGDVAGNGRVFTVGAPEAFVVALQLSAQFAAMDLRESLWSTRYACEILDLEDLAARLATSNSRDIVDEVGSSYYWAKDVLDQIGHRRCR